MQGKGIKTKVTGTYMRGVGKSGSTGSGGEKPGLVNPTDGFLSPSLPN